MTPQGRTATFVAYPDDAGMYAAVDEFPEPGRSPDFDAITITVSGSTSDVDLRALADAAGYSGTLVQAVTVHVNAGVTIGASSTAQAAVIRGSWPAGYEGLTIENRGIIQERDFTCKFQEVSALFGYAPEFYSMDVGSRQFGNIDGVIKGDTTEMIRINDAVQGALNAG